MLTLLALSPAAMAATLVVDPSDTAAYATIGEALDAASSGDTLTVAAGTYAECVDFAGKDLVVQGAGSADTTLDPAGGCAVAVLAQDEETVTLAGLTVRNGAEQGLRTDGAQISLDDVVFDGLGGGGDYGGAVVLDGGTLTATSSSFTGNTGYLGGAIYAYNEAVLSFEDSTFSGNAAVYGGGLLLADDGGDVLLSLVRCTFADNTASGGGGALYGDDESETTATDTVWQDNASSGGNGGAVYLSTDALYTGTGDTFSGNLAEAGRGAGLYGYLDSEITLSGATFTDNAAVYGPHAYSYEGVLTASSSDFSGGVATYNGGGVYAYTAEMTLTDVTFTGNEAANNGGAVYAYAEAALTIDGATFSGNTSGASGGDVGAYAAATVALTDVVSTGSSASDSAYGGSLYLSSLSGGATLDGVVVTGASASYGGALYLSSTGDSTLTACRFSDNAAVYGGAVAWYETYRAGRLIIQSGRYEGNTASNSGGAIYMYAGGEDGASLTLRNATVADNTAETSGGGVYVAYARDLELRNNRFVGNVANGSSYSYYGGGGVYASTPHLVTATGNVWCGNEGGFGGGLYLYRGGAGGRNDWSNNAFVENVARDNGGGVYLSGVAAISLTNNGLLGNDAYNVGGGVYLYQTGLAFVNNLVAWTQDGDALYAYDADSGADATVTHNAFFENHRDDAGGQFEFDATADGNLVGDPLLRDYTLDGDCSNDDLRLAAGSPLIDAGDPSILDLDGSASDIGPYGGPNSPLVDGDGDGYDSIDDCDDDDGAVNPGATEACDGLDNDCDGDVDEAGAMGEGTWYLDGDDDGYGDAAVSGCDQPSGAVEEGGDCDDADASVYPGAEEVLDDGIDQDCDGEDALSDGGDGGSDGGDGGGDGGSGGGDGVGGSVGGGEDDLSGCGCAATSAPASGLAGLALLGLGLARRRA